MTSTSSPAVPASRAPSGVATAFAPLLTALLGEQPPVRFEFWDGTAVGPATGPGEVVIRSPDALRRVVWSPGELGLARAWVAGDLDLRGDLLATLDALAEAGRGNRHLSPAAVMKGLGAATRLGAVGRPLSPPPEEARPVGWRHSKRRDASAVRHHYDVGNDFYRLVLGPSLVYSCARFAEPDFTLEQAQEAKLDLVCRKLGLDERPGARLLDVGCGWGSMALHAARHYGARVVGVTLSPQQAELARTRAAGAGLSDRVEIRVQDYRDVADGPYHAISSIGMSEHVGRSRLARYFSTLHGLLADGGRLLNHAISHTGGSAMGPRSFIGRYVFPDGELIDVGDTVLEMERAGFEVRDVEALREHYRRTLAAWVANLEGAWAQAVALVGERRARAWRLYMAASANAFGRGAISVHQVLGVRPAPGGASHLPPTRRSWG